MTDRQKTLFIPSTLLENARSGDTESKELLEDMIHLQLESIAGKSLFVLREPKWYEMSWWEWTLTIVFAPILTPFVLIYGIWMIVIPTILGLPFFIWELIARRGKKESI